MTGTKKRPRDANQLAKRIVDIAAGEGFRTEWTYGNDPYPPPG